MLRIFKNNVQKFKLYLDKSLQFPDNIGRPTNFTVNIFISAPKSYRNAFKITLFSNLIYMILLFRYF